MEQANTSFRGYQSLDSNKQEIRLLNLQPCAEAAEKIVCELEIASLTTHPQYEALSYCWGDKSACQQILLSNHDHEVTLNLFNALTVLRLYDGPRTLWIDALCIDQSNLDERAKQVTMMSDIYHDAANVRVWLGEDERDLGPHIKSHGKEVESHFNDINLATLGGYLSQMDWWHRVWTVQEAVFAKELYFHLGASILSLDEVARYATVVWVHLLREEGCCRELLPSVVSMYIRDSLLKFYSLVSDLERPRKGQTERSSNILDLTEEYKMRKATDLRDKVFALGSMAQDVPDDFVTYHFQLRDCYVHCAKKLILRSNGLDVLRCMHPAPEAESEDMFEFNEQRGTASRGCRIKGLPSWCPDWSQEIPQWQFRSQRLYRDSTNGFHVGSERDSLALFPSEHCLQITGILCDTVRELDHVQAYYEASGRTETLIKWRRLVSAFVDSCRACDACGEVKWSSLYKCQTCINLYCCLECSQSPSHWHDQHSIVNVYDTDDPTRHGPFERRSVPLPEIATMKDTLVEIRQGVPSDGISLEPGVEDAEQLVVESTWLARLQSMSYPFTDGDNVFDAFKKCLTIGRIMRNSIRKESPVHRFWHKLPEELVGDADMALFTQFWHNKVESIPSIEEEFDNDPTETASNIGRIVSDLIKQNNLFITKKGYIGLGPEHLAVGNLVCVLHRGKMLFVLRKSNVREQSISKSEHLECSLIGQSYVHGLMYTMGGHWVRVCLLSKSVQSKFEAPIGRGPLRTPQIATFRIMLGLQ